MGTLVELGNYLEELGIGIQAPNPNPNLYLGSRPDRPDTVIVLYEYPGGAPSYIQNDPFPDLEHPQVQVVVRARDYVDAAALAARVWRAFAGVTNKTLEGVKYLSIRPNASPAVLNWDTDERVLIFFNSSVTKEVSLAGFS